MLAGVIEHHRHGNVALRLAPLARAGRCGGGAAAWWLVQRLPKPVLARALSVFLLANVVHLWEESGPGGKTQPAREGTAA